MKFTKIQQEKTLNIIQYRINNLRVSKNRYEEFLYSATKKGQQVCHLTVRTRRGNFKHSFYLSI